MATWTEMATARRRAVALVTGGGERRVATGTDAMLREKLRVLEPLAEQFQCVRDAAALERLGEAVRRNGVMALDTETTGLSEWTDHVVGLCVYTPGERAAYIPVGHVAPDGTPAARQIPIAVVAEWLRGLAGVTTVFHHAKFDVKMLWTSFGVRVPIGWDTQIAGELLNENEPHGLKALWAKYCMDPDLPAELAPQSYDALFDDVQLATLDPSWVYIYGARDALMTYELYAFQRPFLTPTDEACERQQLVDTAELYHTTELPLIDVLLDMEQTGMAFDADYAAELTEEYERIRRELEEKLAARAAAWDWSGVDPALVAKISQPINWNSSTQMAIIAYDLAHLPSLDPAKPRSTGSPILSGWKKHPKVPPAWQDWAADLTDYRERAKLVNTYLKAFPALVNPETGRIHSTFFQNGSVTGRLCVAEGTIVAMPYRAKFPLGVRIEQVKAGDVVYSYNDAGELSTERVLWAGATGVKPTVVVAWRASGRLPTGDVCMTPEHQVRLVDGTWQAAGTLTPGMKLRALGTGHGQATVVAVTAGPTVPVYDLEVENTACFIAGGIAVHNSSRNPNFMNLPRDRMEIRRMLRAAPGYYLVSADYSQIEPRGLAHLSQDAAMMQAYREGRDLYASMAAAIWDLPYEDCLEVGPDGAVRPAAKKRRTDVKSILLGIMYGRGGAAIAEQLGVSAAEGNKIVERFFDTFPAVKTCMDWVKEQGREYGYVQTFYGRKRRLPELRWPLYEIYDRQGNRLPPALEQPEVERLQGAWSRKKVEELIGRLRLKGWQVRDNAGVVMHAERQCLNSILQGSSADITKRAMVAAWRDEALKALGFRLLTSVHDELVGEAPQATAVEALLRLEEVMRGAAELSVPVVVDGEISERWGGANLRGELLR